ncbi:hypothetical protein [Pseudomonas aeruginosa]|uniref:hypothetical protein n=1 Tax=Pseudomonas aeruginosa TaxID=287 RepID=UPI0037A0F5E3
MAQQCSIELAPGEVVEIVALFGQADSLAHARDLVTRYHRTDPEETLAGVGRHWRTLLGAVQVAVPSVRWISCSTAGCCTRPWPVASGRARRSAGQRSLWFPRSTAGWHGSVPGRSGADPRASSARRR